MAKILLVEDSTIIAPLILEKVEKELHHTVFWVESFAEAEELIENENHEFLMALIGLYLPDAPNGEIVDYVRDKEIPTLVFTGEFNEKIREKIWAKGIVDYIIKRGTHNLSYIVSIIQRIERNPSIKVLVVDDTKAHRDDLVALLEIHQYTVITAEDGIQALHLLELHPDIKLVIIDYYMPNMNGFELTQKIRQVRNKDELAIIGLSGKHDNNTLSAKFIKTGANDFINRPFLIEEFYCRVTQNIEMVEHIATIREAGNLDYLTRLYNRRYFFHLGRQLFSDVKRRGGGLTVFMIDLDHFKTINDNLGHDAGDAALVHITSILKNYIGPKGLIARFGGEEFCGLLPDYYAKESIELLEEVRDAIEQTKITFNEQPLAITASFGVCFTLLDSLESMITKADRALFQAKTEGRNKIIIFSEN